MEESKQWPHAPIHILDQAGAFMVTAGTYQKQHFFNSSDKLRLLHDSLLCFASEYSWRLQAWAVMSNHYHFVAASPSEPSNLSRLISKLHVVTAKKINQMDNAAGRKVWFQYWDSKITYHPSYLARLNYVHCNPSHHNIVSDPAAYPWCSAAWFERTADPSFYKIVRGLKFDKLKIEDDF